MSFKEVVQTYGYPFLGKEISCAFHEYQKGKTGKTRNKRLKQIRGEWLAPDGTLSRYNYGKYKTMLDAPFALSHKCCDVMKKNPAKKFNKESRKKPITAQMAEESRLRKQKWLQNGCNGFDMKSPISNPMSFWTEQDVLLYIKKYMPSNLEFDNAWYAASYEHGAVRKRARKFLRKQNYRHRAIASVYGDVVVDKAYYVLRTAK